MSAEQPTLFDSRRLGFPSMTDKDRQELAKATIRVFELMNDGEWHHADQIIAASGTREGLRRMRELRQFFQVEGRRGHAACREWQYRLVRKETL